MGDKNIIFEKLETGPREASEQPIIALIRKCS